MSVVRGVIFRLCTGAAVLFGTAAVASSSSSLFDFDGTRGCWPRSLMKASDGRLYGVVSSWSRNEGTTRDRPFVVTESGKGRIGGALTSSPLFDSYGLTETPDGFLWGLEGDNIYKTSTSGERTIVHTFTGGIDGSGPVGGLTLGDDGWLYGITINWGQYLQGTAYRMSQQGVLETLGAFNCYTTGCYARFALAKGSDGAMYGVATFGGDIGSPIANGNGTIFRVTPARGIEVVHQYVNPGNQSEPSSSASSPRNRLLEVDGYLYGSATGGARYGKGEVFRVKLDGSDYQPLYDYGSDLGPTYAVGGFTRLSNGDLVNWGDWYNGSSYRLAAWKLDSRGWPQLIHEFITPPYLAPREELVEASDGSLLGVSARGRELGRRPPECGSILKIVP